MYFLALNTFSAFKLSLTFKFDICFLLENLIIIYHSKDILQLASDSASDSAKCRMMNSDNILPFVKSIENLSLLINFASCKIDIEFCISNYCRIHAKEIFLPKVKLRQNF